MGYLDSLLAFKGELNKGTKLYFQGGLRKSVWTKGWEKLSGKKSPDEYRVHKTKAGLLAVLPHNSDNSLFVHPTEQDKFYRVNNWPEGGIIGNGFALTETVEKKIDELIVYGSSIRKSAYCQELEFGADVFVNHSVSEEGNIVNLTFCYNIISKPHKKAKTVWFDVFPDNFQKEAMACGPLPAGLVLQKIPPGCSINYEATLENLVQLIKPDKMTTRTIFSLFSLDYLVPRVLH